MISHKPIAKFKSPAVIWEGSWPKTDHKGKHLFKKKKKFKLRSLNLTTSLLSYTLSTGFLYNRKFVTRLPHSAISPLILLSSGPQYLSDLLHLYTPSRQLRSSTDSRIFTIPTVRTKTFGQRTFSYQAPVVWNQLFHSIRHSPSLLT